MEKENNHYIILSFPLQDGGRHFHLVRLLFEFLTYTCYNYGITFIMNWDSNINFDNHYVNSEKLMKEIQCSSC